MGFADLHLHSIYSQDGSCSIETILMQAERRQLDVIAITDHNSISGVEEALSKAKKYNIQVIPAIEISTSDGHLLAYEVTKPVIRGLSLQESVLQVHAMNGFCIIPHPQVLGNDAIRLEVLNKALKNPIIAETILGIEMINGGLFRRNSLTAGMAEKLNLAPIGSSDGHNIDSVGRVVTHFEGTTIQELKNNLYQRTTRADWHHRTFDPIFFAEHMSYRILRNFGFGVGYDSQKNTAKLTRISKLKD